MHPSHLGQEPSPKHQQLSRLSQASSPERDLQQWHSASSCLGETISPKTKVPCLDEDASRGHNWFPRGLAWASHSRLSEPFSPEQDNASLKTRVGRLSEKFEQNQGEFQLLSPRRDKLAWARMTVLAIVTHMQQKHHSREHTKCKQASFIQSKISFKHSTDQKHGEITLNR